SGAPSRPCIGARARLFSLERITPMGRKSVRSVRAFFIMTALNSSAAPKLDRRRWRAERGESTPAPRLPRAAPPRRAGWEDPEDRFRTAGLGARGWPPARGRDPGRPPLRLAATLRSGPAGAGAPV